MAQKKTPSRIPKIPETMQAAAIDRFGPPSVLTLHTLPVPAPGPHEVLIALHAAGVGIWDARMRDGAWWPTDDPAFPIVLGTDGAGIVEAKGAHVRRFEIGDRVWAYTYANPKGGFYAEYVAVDADAVGHAPKRLDLLKAGAAAVTGLTALQGIDDVLRVRPKKTVLIFGASGAVGTLAVQFAKYRGAFVVGTATGGDATRLVRRLGADAVIDARSDEAVERLQACAPHGVDAVLALAGGGSLDRLLQRVRPGGWVAYPNGVEPEPRPRPSVRVRSYDAAAGPREFERLARAVEAMPLRVPIEEVYPLAEAARAHQRLEKGHVVGRLVLGIRGGRK